MVNVIGVPKGEMWIKNDSLQIYMGKNRFNKHVIRTFKIETILKDKSGNYIDNVFKWGEDFYNMHKKEYK